MADGFTMSVHVIRNDFPITSQRARQRASMAVRQAGFAVRRFSTPHTPIDKGDLRNRVTLSIERDGLSARLRWQMPYAVFQHEGTRRGIRPKKFAQRGVEQAKPRFVADMRRIYSEGA